MTHPYPAFRDCSSSVVAWEEALTLPTYAVSEADPNPMFFEKRVYQGSCGTVYPLPVHDSVSNVAEEQAWQVWCLENEWVQVVMMPELGGRIQRAVDKTVGEEGYDFFYRQDVIKPALVGLAGPWISGGVEFNWPQHHRPSTFMPADVSREDHDDGSSTVWMSEHEPMNRMKGMVGIRLCPDSSVIEAQVRISNRTPMTQTFLWWANVAAQVHDGYQSFFPPDVRHVADHAGRAMSSFPEANNMYYGIDYRQAEGGGTDLSWYKNIPVPTSYMVTQSDYNFFGGYDHHQQAGFVHVANRHISPGKKQWTWGHHEFGDAWNRELTDEGGPYIELMAGVYTDNQPDFTYLAPYETRTFSHYWWPIQGIGPAHNANRNAAIHFSQTKAGARLGIAVSRVYRSMTVFIICNQAILYEWTGNIAPGQPHLCDMVDVKTHDFSVCEVILTDEAGCRILAWVPEQVQDRKNIPASATEPPVPKDIHSNDELYLTGEHLEQYRHPTRLPEEYWQEALHRDPQDSRCHLALSQRLLRRGCYTEAEEHARAAVSSFTFRHPNPIDGDAYYTLGLCLLRQEQRDAAYAAFYKSTWNYAWRGPAYYHIACIDCHRKEFFLALEHLEEAIAANGRHSSAINLRTCINRHLGQTEEALTENKQQRCRDPLDHWAIFEGCALADICEHKHRGDEQTLIDIACDYASAGFYADAQTVLQAVTQAGPLVYYMQAWIAEANGDRRRAQAARTQATQQTLVYQFPSRPEEELALRSVLHVAPTDAHAAYLLGCLLYDRRRYHEAIQVWEQSRAANKQNAIVHRNLGIAYYNSLHDTDAARVSYAQAVALAPEDGHLFYEYDQLEKRAGRDILTRLAWFEQRRDMVRIRDDLSVEYCALLNANKRYADAADWLASRTFHPWEGGEGKVIEQHVYAHLALSRIACKKGDGATALHHAMFALSSPENLGEVKHLLATTADIQVHIAAAYEVLGNVDQAQQAWAQAATEEGDFIEMSVAAFSPLTRYNIIALKACGKIDQAEHTLAALRAYAQAEQTKPAHIDYFATSLPDLLVFDDDITKKHHQEMDVLLAIAAYEAGDHTQCQQYLHRILAVNPAHLVAHLLQEKIS